MPGRKAAAAAPQEDERIKRLWQEGRSDRQIAAMLPGRNMQWVNRRRHVMGLPNNARPKLKGRVPKNKLPAEVIERTRKLAEEDGLSARQIGAIMGVARGTILRRCHDYKISLKGSKIDGGRGSGKKAAAKAKAKKGWTDPADMTPEERAARAADAREAAARRKAAIEKELAAAAEGALNLPLVSVTRKRGMKPDGGNYKPKHYVVKDVGPFRCHFPLNDGGPFTFCGKPAGGRSAYCAAHEAICCPAHAK